MSPSEVPFWDAVDHIRESDPRFRREAYRFLLLSLGATVNALSAERQADPARRHLSGAELLQGMVALARSEFGAMAPAVFREWGVHASSDVGEMVFQLVECGQLSARPEDGREDFYGFDLMGMLAGGSGGVPARKRQRPSPGGTT
jgi:uncharacterized repeat protein (TIGR04138 family)